MKQTFIVILSFLSFASQAQPVGSGTMIAIVPETPVANPGTITIFRHGDRLDRAFHETVLALLEARRWSPNPFIREADFSVTFFDRDPNFLRAVLWEEYARRYNFAPWNSPLTPEQTFLRNSILYRLHNGPAPTRIIVSPMARAIATLGHFIEILDTLHIPRPEIIVDQRIQEWRHVIRGVPAEIPWEILAGIEMRDSGHRLSPEEIARESTLESRRVHHRRISAVLAEYGNIDQHIIVIGHLDTIFAPLGSEPRFRRIRDVPMGAHVVIHALLNSLGALFSNYGIFNNTAYPPGDQRQ